MAFEVNVTLKSGENPKTFVASAKRDDWHEPTFEEIYGKCDEDKMKNQTKVAVYGGEKYKCNYISGGPSSGYYSWVKASDLDENATLGICSRNRKKDAAVVGDVYYECLGNGNAEGIPASSIAIPIEVILKTLQTLRAKPSRMVKATVSSAL